MVFQLQNTLKIVNISTIVSSLPVRDPNDVDNVVCLGARYNPSVVDRLFSDYQNTTSLEMKRLFVIALGCLTDPASVQV